MLPLLFIGVYIFIRTYFACRIKVDANCIKKISFETYLSISELLLLLLLLLLMMKKRYLLLGSHLIVQINQMFRRPPTLREEHETVKKSIRKDHLPLYKSIQFNNVK